MISPAWQHKEDQDIPDFYEAEVIYAWGKTETLQIASHHLVDKVYETFTDEKGQPRMRCIGVMPQPFYEIWLHQDRMITIPISLCVLKLDKNWSQIVAIKERKKREEAKKENSNG